MTLWKPNLAGKAGGKFAALADAIAEGIADGALKPGEKLPPQRDLAYEIGVSLGTVTRAYQEAERRGLVFGEVGRGTFVRQRAGAPDERPIVMPVQQNDAFFDLALNLPAVGHGDAMMRATLRALAEDTNGPVMADDRASDRFAAYAQAGADWIGRLGFETAAESIIQTVGAQQGILAALMATLRPGDTLLTESLTYSPVRHMARHLGLTIQPVDMDRWGIFPASLADVCRRTAAKVLYTMPTLQSPTTATMPDERRIEIAALARRYDLTIIEDDVFGHLPEIRPLPLIAYAPERGVYITSVSKAVEPGLRVGYVRAPAGLHAQIASAALTACWTPAPLTAEIAARWIADGTADTLRRRQQAEIKARTAIARHVFDGTDMATHPCCLHLWIPLKTSQRAEAIQNAAEHRGIKVLAAQNFAASDNPVPEALRIALGRETDRARLETGLRRLAALLDAWEDQTVPVI